MNSLRKRFVRSVIAEARIANGRPESSALRAHTQHAAKCLTEIDVAAETGDRQRISRAVGEIEDQLDAGALVIADPPQRPRRTHAALLRDWHHARISLHKATADVGYRGPYPPSVGTTRRLVAEMAERGGNLPGRSEWWDTGNLEIYSDRDDASPTVEQVMRYVGSKEWCWETGGFTPEDAAYFAWRRCAERIAEASDEAEEQTR